MILIFLVLDDFRRNYNSGRWAEPKDWKESGNLNYRCLEKIKIRKLA